MFTNFLSRRDSALVVAVGDPRAQAVNRDTLDPAFAARPRLLALRDMLASAVKQLQRTRWKEPAVFFFDRKRQADLEAAQTAKLDAFATLTNAINAELDGLFAHVEVRRIARATDKLAMLANTLAPRCAAAQTLAELLAIPDDEVFLVLVPATRVAFRLHVRGVADVAQLYQAIASELAENTFQLFTSAALSQDGTLPTGFAGCEHWLWPTQPLAAVPRREGERVVLVGAATVQPAFDVEPRFPAMRAEIETIQTLNAFQTTEELSRLVGHALPVAGGNEPRVVAHAA
jgi:hypothetical protein